ncbi:CRAL-TRIO domain-containing protein [Pelagophyceae sp. CCMP2097]|nr:CRAL-TRIO domain-containing protein [Pelagophyceae sp. CCMP2097]
MGTTEDDKLLAALKMPLNETMLETRELTTAEAAELEGVIVPQLTDATLMSEFDANSRIRIFHGMMTNNKGTHEAMVKEAVETYERVGIWRREHAADVMTKELHGEQLLYETMHTHLGGYDLYGHLIWAERLGDISQIVDAPLNTEEAKAIRMKIMEAVRIRQLAGSDARGARRYKQVFIIDLGAISLTTLLTKSAVREMTTAIVSAANGFWPETMWKCFIVNAPFIFRSAYTVISPFIHPVTKEKIKILGGPSKYLPEMEANGIPRSQIPKFLGGDLPDEKIADAIRGINAAAAAAAVPSAAAAAAPAAAAVIAAAAAAVIAVAAVR